MPDTIVQDAHGAAFRHYRRLHTKAERLADGCVHVVGILAGLAASVVMIALAAGVEATPGRIAALAVYCTALLAMLVCSALYNMGYFTRLRDHFRSADHCAIFVMIAGTYTPFTTQVMGSAMGFVLTWGIWTAALAGVALRLAGPDLFERLSVPVYLVLGWLSVVAIWPLASGLTSFALATLVAGGLLYTIGVVFHVWERLPYHNAIWHVFVLGAAACHYAAVLDGVVLVSAQAV